MKRPLEKVSCLQVVTPLRGLETCYLRVNHWRRMGETMGEPLRGFFSSFDFRMQRIGESVPKLGLPPPPPPTSSASLCHAASGETRVANRGRAT